MHTHTQSDQCVIQPKGELGAYSCLLLDQVIDKTLLLSPRLLIDCKELTYISSAGIGVFMSYLQFARENNVRLVFYNLKPAIQDVFSVLKFDELITIVPSETEAFVF